MSTSTWKYNIKSHSVDEQPTMDKLTNDDFWEHSGADAKFLSKEFNKHRKDYKKRIASLRSIPVSGIVDWKDGQELKENIDFTIGVHSLNNDISGIRDISIPIKQEQPQKKPDYNSGWYEKNQVGQQQYQSDLKKWQSKFQSQEQPVIKRSPEAETAIFYSKRALAHILLKENIDADIDHWLLRRNDIITNPDKYDSNLPEENIDWVTGYLSCLLANKNQLQEQPKQEAIESEDEIIDELYAYLKPGEDITCKNSPITTKHLREMFVITRRK